MLEKHLFSIYTLRCFAGDRLTVGSPGESKEPWTVAFVDSYGVNIPITANVNVTTTGSPNS